MKTHLANLIQRLKEFSLTHDKIEIFVDYNTPKKIDRKLRYKFSILKLKFVIVDNLIYQI